MKRLLFALAALAVASPLLAAVNLNTATKDDLVALPGIGPAKAQAILDHRTAHGPFKTVEDVRKVKGIGEKLYLQIKPELTVTAGGAPRPPTVSATPPKPEAKGEGRSEPKTDAKNAARTDAGRIAAKDEKARK